ncbi:MAG TPA: hypothetical protein PKM88_07285 [bacterium]|nr:hypothetical protein [bacterium]
MTRALTIPAGLAVLLALTACTCAMHGAPAVSTTTLGTHVVTVTPGSSATGSSRTQDDRGSRIYEYTCGTVSVRIDGDKLTVNSSSYGTLSPNAAISIDSGTVSVNGQVRRGQVLSLRERRRQPNFETVATLDGRRVTVRPGSAMRMTAQFMDRRTLTIGATEVSIENGALTVNGTAYGTVGATDKILVDNGTVKVNNRVRRTPDSDAAEEEE